MSKIGFKLMEGATPVPRRAAGVLMLITFAEGISMNFYTTITALMLIYQFNIAPEMVGYYAGYIATAYYVGQIISNFPCSWLSDRVGRKPVLICGLISNILCQMIFGISNWFWLCVFLRFINGLTNCFLPVTKCFVRETTDVSNQARLFSIRETGFSIGAMIAPLVGSIFARPVDQPWLSHTFFNSQFFVDYPYALVCFVASAIDLVCLIILIIFMEETLQKKTEPVEIELEEIKNDTNETPNDEEDNQVAEEVKIEEEEEESSDIQVLVDNSQDDLVRKEYKILVLVNAVVSAFSFLDRGTAVTISLYMILALGNIMIIQTIPVWAAQPIENNGLAFEEKGLGIISSIGAIFAIAFQVFLFSPLDSFFGCVVSFRYGLGFLIPIVFFIPMISFLSSYSAAVWATFSILVSALFMDFSWSFGEVNVMINNAARSDSVGSVHGLGTALAALARVIGPVAGTSLFAWSSNLNWYYPLNYMLVFHLVIALSIACLLLSYLVPPNLNRSRNLK